MTASDPDASARSTCATRSPLATLSTLASRTRLLGSAKLSVTQHAQTRHRSPQVVNRPSPARTPYTNEQHMHNCVHVTYTLLGHLVPCAARLPRASGRPCCLWKARHTAHEATSMSRADTPRLCTRNVHTPDADSSAAGGRGLPSSMSSPSLLVTAQAQGGAGGNHTPTTCQLCHGTASSGAS